MLNLFLRTEIASPSFVGFAMTSLRGGTCLSGEAGDEAT